MSVLFQGCPGAQLPNTSLESRLPKGHKAPSPLWNVGLKIWICIVSESCEGFLTDVVNFIVLCFSTFLNVFFRKNLLEILEVLCRSGNGIACSPANELEFTQECQDHLRSYILSQGKTIHCLPHHQTLQAAQPSGFTAVLHSFFEHFPRRAI